MSIKYGECTVIHEPNIFSNISLFFNVELRITNKSKILISFEGEDDICEFNCDTNNNIKNFTFNKSIESLLPTYFTKDKQMYLKKLPKKSVTTGRLTLDTKKLFIQCKKNLSIGIPSIYCGIYYKFKELKEIEVFGILRMKSNDYMPRFQFAYDINEFTKEECIYLLHYLLSQ